MNLSDYVKKRNGVPLGSKNSLRNMFARSLGAGKFSSFGRYWNPIWSYCLGKNIFKPLKIILPSSLSLILTFIICGFIHDSVIMLLRWQFTLIFTPWFLLMGIWVIVSDLIAMDYSKLRWINCALINL